MGTSVPSLAGCWRPPPCRPPGLQRALRATPGVPALPRLCSTCLHTGGISLVPWPFAPGGAALTSGWRPPSLDRRAGWPVEPCVAPARGPGPPHRGLVSRARARDSGRHRAARLPAATLASVWSRFGGRVCPSIASRGRLVASGTLWSGPPARALGRRGGPAAGHTPSLAARALSFNRTWSRRAWCSPSRSALTIMRVQSATRTTASGPGRRSESQTTMCASAGLNMQTTHCGFCCPRPATATLRAHLDQVALNYPSETVVQPSSTAHYGIQLPHG